MTAEQFPFWNADQWDYDFQDRFGQWLSERKGRTACLVGHPHTGEPEPLAHHPCRAREPQELPGARLHHRHGRLRGRLSHLRLDGGGRLDGQRPQPMALQ